jgi:8-oxo-dGTP diphosphatase
MCSHGPVIPQIIAAGAEIAGSGISSELRRSAALSTGEYTVMHFARDTEQPRLVAVETHAPVIA